MSLVWTSDTKAELYVTEAISTRCQIEEIILPDHHRKQFHFLQRYLDFVKLIRVFSISALHPFVLSLTVAISPAYYHLFTAVLIPI